MIDNIRQIFTKATIILMMVLLCLPCFLKRELKQISNFPLIESKLFNPNDTSICPVLIKNENRKILVSYKKEDLKNHNDFTFTSYSESLVQHPVLSSEIPRAATIPIYIVHEQYLI